MGTRTIYTKGSSTTRAYIEAYGDFTTPKSATQNLFRVYTNNGNKGTVKCSASPSSSTTTSSYFEFGYYQLGGVLISVWGSRPVNHDVETYPNTTTKSLGSEYTDWTRSFTPTAKSGYVFVGWFPKASSSRPHPAKVTDAKKNENESNAWITTGTSSYAPVLNIGRRSAAENYVAVFGTTGGELALKGNGGHLPGDDEDDADYEVMYTNTKDTSDFDYGDTISPNPFVRDGYYFNGWNTAADGSGTDYADGAVLSEAVRRSDLTLYAKWTRTEYHVVNSNPDAGVLVVKDADGNTLAAEQNGVLSFYGNPSVAYRLCLVPKLSDVSSATLTVGTQTYSVTVDGYEFPAGSNIDGTLNFSSHVLYSIVPQFDESQGALEILATPGWQGKYDSNGGSITFRAAAKDGYATGSYQIKNGSGTPLAQGMVPASGDFSYDEFGSDIIVSVSFVPVSATAAAYVMRDCRHMGTAKAETFTAEVGTATILKARFTASLSDVEVFEFDGWYEEDGGTASVSTANPYEFELDATKTLYAKFKIRQGLEATSMVSLRYGNGTGTDMGRFSVGGVLAVGDAGVDYETATGTPINIFASVMDGYAFDGWFADAESEELVSPSPNLSIFASTRTLYAKFIPASGRVLALEGGAENKMMEWTSKTYVSPLPFNPTACRVDALNRGEAPTVYDPTVNLLRVEMFSAPDAEPTAVTDMENIASQDARRLPVRRRERYLRVTVRNDQEVDAILVGTSMKELAV